MKEEDFGKEMSISVLIKRIMNHIIEMRKEKEGLRWQISVLSSPRKISIAWSNGGKNEGNMDF